MVLHGYDELTARRRDRPFHMIFPTPPSVIVVFRSAQARHCTVTVTPSTPNMDMREAPGGRGLALRVTAVLLLNITVVIPLSVKM